MGILGFEKFQTDKVPGGSNKIQMLDKIREWKITHPDQQPIIIIRLKELLMSVIQLNVKAAIFGGSHQFYHERLDTFFKQFQDLNVKLVFFGGGRKEKDKLLKLCIKTDQDYKKYIDLLKHVDKRNEVKLCARPELRIYLGLYEEGIARKYGEYVLSTGLLNKDIVQYARQNDNVIAIMAKDSDFLLYSLGSVDYWICGIAHLNFNDMTTLCFNQKALLDYVELTPHQFHVMVAIAGVILDDPKKHCFRVLKEVFKQKIPGSIEIIQGICDCVKKNVPEQEEKPNFGAWTTIMFASCLEEYCWLIEKQFKKYDVTHTFAGDTTEAEEDEFKYLKKYKNIWTIINDEVIRVNQNFVDLGRWNNNRNAMAFHNVFVLVFKRAIGIVLNFETANPPQRRFLMKGSENERCKILPKSLIHPLHSDDNGTGELSSNSSLIKPFKRGDIPTLEKLIDENNTGDEAFTTLQWSLLFWVLHKNFDDDLRLKIRSLPKEMVPVVLTVLFLLWENQITPMEGDTIIISENDVMNQTNGPEQSEYPDKADGRTIRVAHIYVHARVLINRCFQICGIDLFNIPVSFDGVHFHNLLNKFVENSSLFEDKKTELKGLQIDEF